MNNKIKEDYVSFEVAKLLKERGFAWLDHTIVANDGKPTWSNPTGVPISLDNGYNCYEENGVPIRPRKYTPTNTHYPRPTHALAIKWIRNNSFTDIWSEPFLSENPKVYIPTILHRGEIIKLEPRESFFLSNEAALQHTLQNLIR